MSRYTAPPSSNPVSSPPAGAGHEVLRGSQVNRSNQFPPQPAEHPGAEGSRSSRRLSLWPHLRWGKRLVTKVAIVGSGLAAVLVMAAGPASASGSPETVGGGPTIAYASPTPYSNMVGGYFPDTYVSMYCWTDYAWSYGTNRWFLVGGVGFNPYTGRITWIEGFVSANRVWNQARVGHC
jgi:hypothetical protein